MEVIMEEKFFDENDVKVTKTVVKVTNFHL